MEGNLIMFEGIMKFFNKLRKKEEKVASNSKNTAKTIKITSKIPKKGLVFLPNFSRKAKVIKAKIKIIKKYKKNLLIFLP